MHRELTGQERSSKELDAFVDGIEFLFWGDPVWTRNTEGSLSSEDCQEEKSRE
jgi:hypothetical protein